MQVVAIEAAVPALEELHLCDNSLTALGPPLLMCPVTDGAPAHMRLLFPRLKVRPLCRHCFHEPLSIVHVSFYVHHYRLCTYHMVSADSWQSHSNALTFPRLNGLGLRVLKDGPFLQLNMHIFHIESHPACAHSPAGGPVHMHVVFSGFEARVVLCWSSWSTILIGD